MHCWSGSVELLPGLGVFRGRSGDNRPHRHWAHQVVLRGSDDDRLLELRCGDLPALLDSAFIPAGLAHQLGAAEVISVYIDPTTTLGRAVHAASAADGLAVALTPALAHELRCAFDGSLSIAQGAAHLHQILVTGVGGSSAVAPDTRLAAVLAALRRDVADPERAASGAGYAALAGLSASRFSHWFREQTGMPLRSYRKWLRLIHGLEHALCQAAGAGRLTQAAHQSRFADQAHFTRTFVDMFGIRPSDALAALDA
jgi:AraC-like DNA-binding protein